MGPVSSAIREAMGRRSAVVLIGVLLAIRLGVSVWSTAGIGWDFPNYHHTARIVTGGELHNLYRLPQSRLDRYHRLIGEPEASGTPTVDRTGDPYVPSERLGFIGFPISAYVFAPMGWLQPRWAVLLFKATGAIFFVISLTLLYRMARRSGTLTPAVYLLICLLYSPFWFVFSTGGQATPLNLLLFVLFWRAFAGGQVATAAMWLALGILIKPFFALLLPILVIGGEWRAVLRVGAWLGLGVSVSILFLGWPLHAEWLNVLRVSSQGTAEPWWNNSSIFGAIYTVWSVLMRGELAPAGELHGPILVGVGLLKLVILGVFAHLSRQVAGSAMPSAAKRESLAGLAIMFALCFSNIVWPHYLAFLFVPVVLALFRTPPLPKSIALTLWAILISTLAVESRFAQRFALSLIDQVPVAQAVVAGAFGACTMLLTFGLLVAFRRQVPSVLTGSRV